MTKENELSQLIRKYPELAVCEADITAAVDRIAASYRAGGKLLVCGNGGSASDSDHIVGELMKGFMSKRPLSETERVQFVAQFPESGSYLADHLQGALPAISLIGSTALTSAYANDVAADMIYAQQVFGYGIPGDVLLGISTSGNSANVVRALQTAKVKRVTTIGLTGRNGGQMNDLCDIVIRVPWDSTPDIQERHLPIYHTMCVMLEQQFFG
ncbi:SIS domain-containing protein [Paenibacillus sp. GCM10027626]|uniref:D-sedoheptulose-7-phosphate isomerase n=1 Tax=Paenibacillus sp. GCM10027626 TaxID=3273411 RepID=UPI003629656A